MRGDATHALLQSQNSTDQNGVNYTGFRILYDGSTPGPYYFVGFDVDKDGSLDAFLGVKPTGNGAGVYVYNADPSQANTSPSTTGIINNQADPRISLVDASHGSVSADASTSYYTVWTRTSELVAALSNKTGTAVTAASALSYLVFSATQDNSINGDLGGAAINSAASFTSLGVFTSQSLSAPTAATVLTPPSGLLLVQDTGASNSDSITSNDAVQGTAAAGSTITLLEGSTILGTAVTDSAGLWTITPSNLSQGARTVTATATDSSGNTSSASTGLSFTLDTTAPVVTGALARDTGASATDHVTADPTLTGSGDPGAIVTLTEGGTILGTVTAAASGAWSFTPILADGTHTIVARETDAAGNIGDATTSFTMDTRTPAAPVVPTLAAASDSGIPGDGITSDSTPTLTGTAEAGSTVTLTDGTSVLGTALADGAGLWSFTLVTTLADGTYGITATSTDAAGNTSPASTALALTVDTAIPAVPSGLALASTSDSGIQGDGITSDSTPTLTGSAEAGSTVTLTDGVSVLGKVQADSAGLWSFTPVTALADGAHSITATQADAAGNVSSASAPLPLTIDTTIPSVPSGLTLAAASDSGIPGDGITSDSTPTLTGSAEAGSTVTLTDGASVLGTALANGVGQWSFTPNTALADGAYSVTATATDAAGNVSSASTALALTIDTAIPSVPSGLALAPASDGGTVGDGRTSDSTPTLTGSAEAGSTVTLTDGVSVLGKVQADSAGLWSFTPVTALADGAYSITATSTDAAGNTSVASAPLPLTIDTTIQPVPSGLTLAPASDSGILGDGVTSDSTPTLTGSAGAGSTVTLTDGASVLGTVQADSAGLWSFTPVTALAEGAHNITATSTDAAGNISPASTVLALTIDTTTPPVPSGLTLAAASDSGIPGDGITSDSTPTLTGSAEAGSTVTLTDGASVLGTVRADSTGLWSFTPVTNLADGLHSITAIATDAAGNVSPASAPLPLTIDTTIPSVPSGLTLAAASDSGVPGDGITSDSTPTLTGTAEAGSTVTLTDTSTGLPVVLGIALANGAGQWSFTPTTALADGLRSVTATATDAAGNVFAASAALALTIDTAIPTAPSGLALALASDSGIPDDRRTNVSRPVVTGRGVAGDTVTLFDGLTLIGSATVAQDGTWSVAPSADLSDGTHALTITQTDAAGNVSPASATLALTIDTAVPALTTGSQIPNDDTPTISGRATPGSTVALFANGVAIGSTVADATTGIFGVTADTPLALGLNRLTTTQTTASGTSAPSAPLIVFVVEAPEAGISTTDFSSADIGGALDLGARLAFIGGTEAVLLTDATLSVGTNTNQATLQRLYQGLLGRGNDTRGITYWDDQLNHGVSKAVVAAGFLTTDEYLATHSVQTDEQFVTSLYQGLLGRAPEQGGLAVWTGALAQGASRGDIVIGIADSDEAKSHLAPTTAQVYVPNDAGTLTHVLYETGLGREVELPALAYWKAAYEVLTPPQLAALIASSTEFTAFHAGQSNDAFVESLYQAGLGRSAEASGLASWTTLLSNGSATRADVLLGVATSDEAHEHLTYNLSGAPNS